MLEDIQRLEEALRRAMLASDVHALDTIVGDGLIFVAPHGGLIDKAADLAAHASGAMRFEEIELSEQEVRIFGETAVVMVRARLRGSMQGTAFSGDYRYTRIWLHASGRWRIVAGHASEIVR